MDLLSEKPEFKKKFEELVKSNLYISVITSTEIMSGAVGEKQKEEFSNFLDSFTIIPVSDELARKAGITRRELIENGYKKSIPDILIGQTAIESNLILVTGNPKDFPQLNERKLLLPFPD